MLTTLFIVLGIWLILSFSCSLMEACLLSVGRADLATFEGRSPSVARTWTRFRERLQYPLAVILILNTLAHTVGAAISGSLFGKMYGERWLWVFSLGVSFVMIQWTELLPKSLGVRYKRVIAPAIAFPLRAAVALFRPVVWFLHFLNRPFERRTGAKGPDPVDDIYALARFAALTERIDPAQEKIIAGATGLSHRTSRDFMIPREDISFLSTEMSLNDALVKAHEDAHTRYPVTEGGDPDKVVGYVNFKEMVAALRTNPEQATLRGICRPVLHVPPDERASSLIQNFVGQHQHIAVVRDAEEKTLGLVTLEDILEEPLGEVGGEFDHLPSMIHELQNARWMVGGGVTMEELRSRLGKPLPGLPNEGTVADWIIGVLGRPPRPHEVLENWGLRVTVRRIRRRKVFEAILQEL